MTIVLFGFSQTNNSESAKIESVTFEVKVELKNATKDGIYLKGYVVNIEYEDLKKLDGKTIEVSGIAIIRKGLWNTPEEYNDQGNEILKQGRKYDVKYIEKPSYRIIKK